MCSVMLACKPTLVIGKGISKPCVGVYEVVSFQTLTLDPDADSDDDDTPQSEDSSSHL